MSNNPPNGGAGGDTVNGPHGIYSDRGPDEWDDPTCPICGSPDVWWVNCWQCGGEGGFDGDDLMDEDPLWYDEDSYETCDICRGDGGWYQCSNGENHPKQEVAQ